MQSHEFSWTKILCFFGAAICAMLAFACIGTGIGLIVEHFVFKGVVTILGGVASLAWAVALYKYYNWWQDKQSKSK